MVLGKFSMLMLDEIRTEIEKYKEDVFQKCGACC